LKKWLDQTCLILLDWNAESIKPQGAIRLRFGLDIGSARKLTG
jgi:hypothetical protein